MLLIKYRNKKHLFLTYSNLSFHLCTFASLNIKKDLILADVSTCFVFSIFIVSVPVFVTSRQVSVFLIILLLRILYLQEESGHKGLYTL